MSTAHNTTAIFPPPYTIKRHPQARHVKLKASIRHGLQLIVPLNFNIRHIPAILQQNQTWIETQFSRLQAQQAPDILPTEILLRAIGQTWKIEYVQSNSKLQIITRPQHEIVLLGKIKQQSQCKKLLLHWVKAAANMHLSEQLKLASQKTALSYKKLTLRNQQTRWGSCTQDKSISLNYQLIFFPPELAQHIIIHELCHTVYLDHSEKFWQLVAKFDPEWQQHRQSMRKARQYIPYWI